MTDNMMKLRAVLDESPDANLLREMIGFSPNYWRKWRHAA